MVTSYNLGADGFWLFRTADHSRLRRDWRERGRRGDGDLGRADHLPGVPLAGTRLIDGEVWANNPAMAAVVEPVGTCATRLEDPRERFEMTRTGQAAAGGAPLAGALPVPATPLLGPEQEAAAVEGLVPCCRVRPGRNQCFKPPDHPAAGNDAGPPPGTLTASVNHRL